MPPSKLTFVRLAGRVLSGLSILALIYLAISLFVMVAPNWEPQWVADGLDYKSVYYQLSNSLLSKIPWLLATWGFLTLLAAGLWISGDWPKRANLIRE